MSSDRERAMQAKAWPFQEARKLLERTAGGTPAKDHVLFETGYGPSGLPHIGTFGEVVRTTMVRQAFARLTDIPTRLITFSDDMDGLRKVPDNIPKREMFENYVDKRPLGGVPLTSIDDPDGCHESYGHHNNAKLREFMDSFGFEYEFQSATDCYTSGRFDETLLKILEHYDEILEAALSTVGPERRKTYGLFLPKIHDDELGLPRYIYVRPQEVRPDKGTIVFRGPNGKLIETPVTGGHCKPLWRVDWALRWAALGVDYEMSGKDLIDSVKLSSRICRILGATPPEGFTYELFLDENGEKISKSKGNGIAVEEWLGYAPWESLSLYMYRQPRRAKRLYFDVIPRHVDDYLSELAKLPEQDPAERLENPVWHIHDGAPAAKSVPVSFGLLLNLASASSTEDEAVLWGFISRHAPGATPQADPLLDRLVGHALAYYRDFVKPKKRYRAPSETEKAALKELAEVLATLPADAEAEAIQFELYEVGKRHPFPDLKTWFQALYEILLGTSRGPRMGSFIALYGIPETVALIRRALAGKEMAES
ncbi:MAG: lysine--tRNA ligase [Proteobacteria bacterium]|nr:lysine--tRNA ligase [Pseudomonadota bacterium]